MLGLNIMSPSETFRQDYKIFDLSLSTINIILTNNDPERNKKTDLVFGVTLWRRLLQNVTMHIHVVGKLKNYFLEKKSTVIYFVIATCLQTFLDLKRAIEF